ncbi:hypothetical protein NKR23_g3650 [Pleurostoma richardsiae]|uniref:Cutinase n=1 Tax=Pleurostoma richardsiae TaxID=41990 RepID=A0AA38RXM1_9PEZI|nr:hypothetical protein NKR23_g3650 [Pleurostoma richardsiae]
MFLTALFLLPSALAAAVVARGLSGRESSHPRTAICSGLSSCDYEDIQFNNTAGTDYCGAVAEGAASGLSQMAAYNERCPGAKLVLSGYSQGAQVAGDILGGGGGTFFDGCVQPASAGLDPSTGAGSKVVAALTFGDVRHAAGQSYNVLSGAGDSGIYPRAGDQLASLNRFAGVLRAYCVSTDPECALGDDIETHLNYFDIYSDDAGTWVQDMVGSAGVSAPSSSFTSVVPTTNSAVSTSTTVQTTSEGQTSSSTSTLHYLIGYGDRGDDDGINYTNERDHHLVSYNDGKGDHLIGN